jgi:hypothetical protein
MTRTALTGVRDEGNRLGWPPIAPALEKRIREALATPGRPGMRKIAARFGVNPGTGSGSAALSSRQASSPSSPSRCKAATAFVIPPRIRTTGTAPLAEFAHLVSGEHLARPFLIRHQRFNWSGVTT